MLRAPTQRPGRRAALFLRSVPCLACVLLVASGTTAHAAPGGVFAGPTRATGFSMLWNPAALASEAEAWSVMIEVTTAIASAHYARDGLDPNNGQPYEEVGFTTPVPDAGFILAAPTPFPWLRVIGGGFSPTTLGAIWPEDGPQRWFSTNSKLVTYAVTAGLLIIPSPNYGFSVTAGPVYGFLEMRHSIDFGAFANGLLPPGAPLFPLEDPQLEARSFSKAAGWTSVVVAGAWAKPLPWLRLGLGVSAPRGLILRGSINIETSEALRNSLSGFNLSPTGRIEVRYPMPWQLSTEVEVEIDLWRVATNVQFLRKGIQNVIIATVTEVEPNFIEGRQVSVKNGLDDWLFGARVSRSLGNDWEVAFRVDYDRRSIPDETLHPGNLEFSTVDLSLGARWHVSKSTYVTLTYAYIIPFSMHIQSSIFTPSAPNDSGLGMPNANGRYSATAHLIGLAFDGIWATP